MKKIITLITTIILTGVAMAQAPQKISYQAVIRDAGNVLITNQTVGTQISILQTTSTGIAAYIERHTPTSNANGLISFAIGTGTVVAGNFITIDWSNGPYFVKIETDPLGGTAYTISGTSQLLSVPYALHAKTVENITELDPIFGASIAGGISATDTANWNAHTIDTDTHIDSSGVVGLGFVAGAHITDTDTQLDSSGVASLGFVAGSHTVDTDTQLDSTDIANLGYTAGPHTIDTDTQLDSLGVVGLGFVAGAHTVDTDTQLDSTDIANLGYVAGPEVDGSITNEIQILNISNDTVFLSNGGFVKLPPSVDTLPFPGSTLMNSMEQQKMNMWIGNPHQKWKKCYTKTINGATSTIFHNLCDNRGPSVTVFKLNNGRTLGGYIENSWTNNFGGYKGYDKAFLFSIDSLSKHPIGHGYAQTSYHNSSYGPTFGTGHDILINSTMNLGYLNFPYAYSYKGSNANSPTDAACQALGGVNRQAGAVNIDEIEVWILED
jgi:hypothetical protein